MKIFIEVLRESFLFFKSAFFTLLGLVYKYPDSPTGKNSPVILIPGILGSSLVWGKLRKLLIENGYPVYTPVFNYQLGKFENSGRLLEEYILEKKLNNCIILGHSAGGILATQMGFRGRGRLKKLYGVASPFHGTLLAIFIFLIPSGRQLIPRSRFLKNNEVNFNSFSNLQSIYSSFDLTIFPGFQARLGRNDDICYNEIGHLNIYMSRKGAEFLFNQIQSQEDNLKKVSPSAINVRQYPKKESTTSVQQKRKSKNIKSVSNQKVPKRAKITKKKI